MEIFEKRFWEKVRVSGSCWLWMASKKEKGYGQFFQKVNNVWKCRKAHVVSYEVVIGDIPEGKILDHLCRVRSCVNPFHVEPVTNKENVLRGNGPSALNARKLRCKNGHSLIEGNLGIYEMKHGKRKCIVCKNSQARIAYQKRKVYAS